MIRDSRCHILRALSHGAFLLLLSLHFSMSSSAAQGQRDEGVGRQTGSRADSLVFAAWDGDLERVESLVSEGVDVNAAAGPGLTAHHCAKLRGNQTMLEWLLANGAKPGLEMPDRNQIADMIFKRNALSDAPGGALAVVRKEDVIHQSCYGLANVEHAAPITPATVFKLASVSKQFTAFAICM